VLLVTPSADFFAEPHVDGLIGYAKVFHQAGISWTLSSHASEAANFGLFIGSQGNMQRVAMRIREAALELGVKRIIVGECGHAWRVAYSYWNTLIGPFDFLDPNFPAPQHICEATYDLVQNGALKFNKEENDDKVVTFHDSCNVSRASRMGSMPGGQYVIPRALIKASCNHFIDMRQETIHEGTFCCGGGGGLLTDDLVELRVKGALPRMQALHEVIEEHEVTHMAAICAICKSQFTKVLPYYDLGMDMIISVHQLVGDALELGVER
jgi:Fe-S oxidoreductase